MSIKKIIINFNKILLIVSTLSFSLIIKFPHKQIAVNKYFLFFSLLLMLIFYILNFKNLRIVTLSFPILIYVVYYIFQDIYVSNNSIGSGVFWWIFLLIFLPYFYLQEKSNLELSIKIFLISIIFILFIDFIYRFYFNPWLVYRGISMAGIKYNFYLYKLGLIGSDTNTTGVICSLCFFSSLILNKMKIINSRKYSLIFLIFTIFRFL